MARYLQKARQRLRQWRTEPRVLWKTESSQLRTTVEVQHWLPFPVFLVTLGWYIAAPAPVVMMAMLTVGGILLSGFLWAREMARRVRGQRDLRFAAMQVGDELEEEIHLTNKSFVPVIWAEFVDRSNIPGYTVSSARAAEPNSRVWWRAQTVCTRRGIFSLGPWELRLGEPFGIFLVRQLYLQHQEILVYPPLAELPEHILPHRGALGDHRPLNQPLRAETIASTSVRAYAPGDPLRHIHWPTTARRSNPFVKIFAPEAASSVWLLPDFDEQSHVGEGEYSSQETMVTVTASVASALLQQNLSVGMFARAGEENVTMPRQGQAHLWTLLQNLAPLYAAPDRPLEDSIDRARVLVSGNDLIVVITPSLRPEWVSSLRRIAGMRGRTRAEVILLDPASFLPAQETHTAAQALDFLPVLLEQGIPANILRREDVRLISGYYGELRRWEFAVTGTGKVVALKTPRRAEKNAQSAGWQARE
jgi:uncharacterized protein (DUF58 family)